MNPHHQPLVKPFSTSGVLRMSPMHKVHKLIDDICYLKKNIVFYKHYDTFNLENIAALNKIETELLAELKQVREEHDLLRNKK
jgi:hypothetical protein